MKIAYFDCQYGAAGDMLNAALLAAGADEGVWRTALASLGLPKVQLKLNQVNRCNLMAMKLDVLNEDGVAYDELNDLNSVRAGLAPPASEHHHEHHEHHHDEHGHHHHEHHHHHVHHHQEHHHHDHEHSHEHGDHDHRHLPDILHLIEHAQLTPGAKSLASRIFTRLAEAEARVHGMSPHDVVFHEVGAVDSIVDIVGFAIAYDSLGIEKSYGSSVAIGSGTVKSQHGIFPVPGPATMYLLEAARVPIAASTISFECLTPTGAAILCEVVSEWGRQPAMQAASAIGYGAGTKNPPKHPNVVRVIIGEASDTASGAQPSDRFTSETLAVVEANLDDFNPQALAFAVDRLFAAGALDVTVAPVLMKKGRAGQVLTVLCKPADRVRIQERILEETSSIGVRWYAAERLIAQREWQEVELSPGSKVRLKIARDNRGQVVNVQPEFDDCVRYAEQHHVPVKEVLIDAMAKFKRNGHSH
jgi:pyridinium-3,5-bisthiocarboxylic acid mononucleotide nickel chelatase